MAYKRTAGEKTANTETLHMLSWFRKKPDVEALATAVGQACVAAREIVSGFVNGGVFSPEETNDILETLPHAIHALALHHLHIGKVAVLIQNEATIDRLYSGSKAAMLKAALNDSVTRSWLANWEITDYEICALRAAEEADGAAMRRYSEDFLIWNYFTDYWAPATSEGYRANGERAMARAHKLSLLGRLINNTTRNAS